MSSVNEPTDDPRKDCPWKCMPHDVECLCAKAVPDLKHSRAFLAGEAFLDSDHAYGLIGKALRKEYLRVALIAVEEI